MRTSDQQRPTPRRQLQKDVFEPTAPVRKRVAQVLNIDVRRDAPVNSVLLRHCEFFCVERNENLDIPEGEGRATFYSWDDVGGTPRSGTFSLCE